MRTDASSIAVTAYAVASVSCCLACNQALVQATTAPTNMRTSPSRIPTAFMTAAITPMISRTNMVTVQRKARVAFQAAFRRYHCCCSATRPISYTRFRSSRDSDLSLRIGSVICCPAAGGGASVSSLSTSMTASSCLRKRCSMSLSDRAPMLKGSPPTE